MMGTGDTHYHRARSLLLLTLCSALLSLGRGGGGGGGGDGGGGATPILGWNNCQLDCGPRFPTDALVRATALQLHSTGLAAAGYTHLNLDDAWMAFARDPVTQRQVPDAARFPDFPRTLRFIRSLNLSAGLYTASGTATCSGRAGSCRHEETDAAQFVEWGLAHVKDDACSVCRVSGKKGAAADYAAMAGGLKRAAAARGVPAPLLMVEGQPPFPEAADGRFGDVRRVGHDINANWSSMLSLVDIGSGLWPYARPGFFNDLEMMELGNGDFDADDSDASRARARAHMTMWSIMKSPLVLSTNLSSVRPETLAVAMSSVALEVNQDSLGRQARRVKSVSPANVASSPSSFSNSNIRDTIAAVVGKCDPMRATQRWRWSRAVDSNKNETRGLLGSSRMMKTNKDAYALNGTLFTMDDTGSAWCLGMQFAGIWGVWPYTPGNNTHPTACVDSTGQASSWRAERSDGVRGADNIYAFVWRNGNRPYGFAWGQDFGSSGPLPHTRWLQSNNGGNWTGDLEAAAQPNSTGVPFSPDTGSVIDDDGVGHVSSSPGSDFCLDVVASGNVETWASELEGERVAVAVLNRTPTIQQSVVVMFADVGFNASSSSGGSVRVRSAWGEEGQLLEDGKGYAVTVPGQSAALLVFEVAPR